MKELSLHILDLLQNSITAGSSLVYVSVELEERDSILRISVTDNGCGMDEETCRKATSPFSTSRTTRKVGLGIPLFKEACEQCGGNLLLESEPGKGTMISGTFKAGFIDRQPLGNLGNVIGLNLMADTDIRFMGELRSSRGLYEFDSDAFLSTYGNPMDASFEAEKEINQKAAELFNGLLPEYGGDIVWS